MLEHEVIYYVYNLILSHDSISFPTFFCVLLYSCTTSAWFCAKQTGNLIGKAMRKSFFLCKNATTILHSFANLHLNELFLTSRVARSRPSTLIRLSIFCPQCTTVATALHIQAWKLFKSCCLQLRIEINQMSLKIEVAL